MGKSNFNDGIWCSVGARADLGALPVQSCGKVEKLEMRVVS
jgi:hypothetical protein